MKCTKKQKTLLIILSVILVLAVLAGLFLPIPEAVDIQITGCEIDANGNFLREGSIVIQGVRLGYLLRHDRCLCSSLTIIDDRFLMLSEYISHFLSQSFITFT